MKFASTHIEHHTDGSHTVKHMPQRVPSKSGAFMQGGEATGYTAKDNPELMAKMQSHLQSAMHEPAEAPDPGDVDAAE
jgi:hypothetical protein